jgi:hypothetical protein
LNRVIEMANRRRNQTGQGKHALRRICSLSEATQTAGFCAIAPTTRTDAQHQAMNARFRPDQWSQRGNSTP